MNQQPVDIQTRETDEKQLEMTYKCTIVYEKKSCKQSQDKERQNK